VWPWCVRPWTSNRGEREWECQWRIGVYGQSGVRWKKCRSFSGRAPFAKAVSPRESRRVPRSFCLTTDNETYLHDNNTTSFPSILGNYIDRLKENFTMSHSSRPSTSRISSVPSQKPRQLSHLQAQLAQLTANMADLESLMRMTAGQAQDMRALGGYSGAM
jgi:hypothetical protein